MSMVRKTNPKNKAIKSLQRVMAWSERCSVLISFPGDFFIHFLDSPEQGLLVIPLFTDILPNGGGTWICSEGVGKLAQWLVSRQCPLPTYSVQQTNRGQC